MMLLDCMLDTLYIRQSCIEYIRSSIYIGALEIASLCKSETV